MSINPNVQYPGRVTAPDADYPYASSKNETSPGLGDGTPYEKARANDIFGMQQALLKSANITPSGNADTVNDSEYVASMVELASGRAFNYNDGGIVNAYILNVQANQQGPRSYFDGMKAFFIAQNSNTAASSVNINGIGVVNIANTNLANTIVAGERVELLYRNSTGEFDIVQEEGASFQDEIRTITGTVAANDLILGLNATTLSFRDVNIDSGIINTREIIAQSLTVPIDATLGSSSNLLFRLILLAIDNAGTVELAVVNQAGGNNLDETTLISTTAISASADSDSIIYSTTARTNVSFRVVGYIETQQTLGFWISPTIIQGAGGNALTAMNSLGHSQTWRDLTNFRIDNVFYYNTTGKPIYVSVVSTQFSSTGVSITLEIDGMIVFENVNDGAIDISYSVVGIVPPGSFYKISLLRVSILKWLELS